MEDTRIKIPLPIRRNPIIALGPSSTNTSGGFVAMTERGIAYEMQWGRTLSPNTDVKRLKRILSNRVSAQNSRMRKVQYLNALETKAKDLEAQKRVLASLIDRHKQKKNLLESENSILKANLSDGEERAKQGLAMLEENKAELKRLREQIYAANQQKMHTQEELSPLSKWNSMEIELDPVLSLTSLTIDPPQSLM